MHREVLIAEADFNQNDVVTTIRKRNPTGIGGLVTFTGLVREHNMVTGDASRVATLTFEHYPGMTEASIDRIIDHAEGRWPLLEVQVIHRVGQLCPSDQIVLVAVASAHRAAAFAAAEFIMDCLKTEAVFWKKEHTHLGEHWVQSTDTDEQRRERWSQS